LAAWKLPQRIARRVLRSGISATQWLEQSCSAAQAGAQRSEADVKWESRDCPSGLNVTSDNPRASAPSATHRPRVALADLRVDDP
jgi:hypothetical protein